GSVIMTPASRVNVPATEHVALDGRMTQDRNLDEERVRSLDDQERMATLERNVPALERLWSEDFTVNAPNNQVVVGRRAVLESFGAWGVINFARFERQFEFIRGDGGFVVIRGLETVQQISDAPAVGLAAGHTIERRFTNVWKNEAGSWRLFARHANVIPKR